MEGGDGRRGEGGRKEARVRGTEKGRKVVERNEKEGWKQTSKGGGNRRRKWSRGGRRERKTDNKA